MEIIVGVCDSCSDTRGGKCLRKGRYTKYACVEQLQSILVMVTLDALKVGRLRSEADVVSLQIFMNSMFCDL